MPKDGPRGNHGDVEQERGPSQPPIGSDQYRHVIGHFASGVTVVTTVDGREPFGTTASAVCSLSLEPPALLVCLNRSSATGEAIRRSGRFVVNILSDKQEELARRFATKGSGKFTDVSTVGATDEKAVVLDGAVAHLDCRLTDAIGAGTHVILIGRVESAHAHDAEPLAYYRGTFGRLRFGG